MNKPLNNPRQTMTAPRCALLLAAVALSAQVVFCGCNDPAATAPRGAVGDSKAEATVETAFVSTMDMTRKTSLPVSLEGYEQTMLVSRIEGYVKDVAVDIGDTVKKGDLLIELDAPELEAENDRRQKLLEQAQQGLQVARAGIVQANSRLDEQQALKNLRDSEFKRVSSLVSKGSLSADRLDEAKFSVASANASLSRVQADITAAEADLGSAQAAIEVAGAELAKAKAMSGFRRIVAPFDGVITMRNVDAGAYVVPSAEKEDALLRIERVSKLRGVMYINSSAIDSDANVTLHAISGLPDVLIDKDIDDMPLKISRTSRVFDSKTRLMRIEIAIKPPVDPTTGRPLLKPGDYATATLNPNEKSLTAAVPTTAIGEDADGNFVMVLAADRICRRVNVEAGVTKGNLMAVKPLDQSYILMGKRVIASDPAKFQDGKELKDDVKIEEED